MSIRMLGKRLKPPTAPTPGEPPPAGGAPGLAGVSAAALEAAQRDAAVARAREAAAAKALDAANRQLAEAKAAGERQAIESAILASATRPDRKALNAAHVVRMRASEYMVHDGKVVLRADPTKDVEASLGEWFAGEGKYLLAPALPSGGAGAPGRVTGVQPAAPPDLKTDAGLTARTRQIMSGMYERPAAKPAAPAGAVAPGAGATAPAPGPTTPPPAQGT